MPRGKKKSTSDEVTYTISKDANTLGGTENSKMRVYTSKPKKEVSTKSSSEKVDTAAKKEEKLEDSICSFVHITVYCVPEIKQFVVENHFRREGKSAIIVPASYFQSEYVDIKAVNAVFGMHFEDASQNAFEMIRQAITQDSDNIRVFQICELGIFKSDGSITYNYITY